MSRRRLYPEKPAVGIGVLIQDGEQYLLIKRAAEPDAGLWSIPGGLVEIGEKTTEAAVREVREETGLEVEITKILGVVDKIIKEKEKIKFHFVIVDYLAHLKGGILRASSDALEAIWVKSEDFTCYELSPTLIRLLKQINLYPDD